eukprot:772674_1
MAAGFLPAIIIGFFIAGFLVLGHVFGMLAAEWSMDILDLYPTCVRENEFDFVNGDFSEALNIASWAGLVIAVFMYAALIVGSRGNMKTPFYVVLCIYIIAYVAWFVLLLYIWLFFSYIYFEETRLVTSCGGLEEVRNVWWICLAAVGM